MLMVSIVLILVVTLMPGDGKVAGNYLDKVVHFIVFFFLSININYKFFSNKKQVLWILMAILLGFVTEIIQQFIPGRNMDIYDALADFAGVGIGFLFYTNRKLSCDKILKKMGA